MALLTVCLFYVVKLLMSIYAGNFLLAVAPLLRWEAELCLRLTLWSLGMGKMEWWVERTVWGWMDVILSCFQPPPFFWPFLSCPWRMTLTWAMWIWTIWRRMSYEPGLNHSRSLRHNWCPCLLSHGWGDGRDFLQTPENIQIKQMVVQLFKRKHPLFVRLFSMYIMIELCSASFSFTFWLCDWLDLSISLMKQNVTDYQSLVSSKQTSHRGS